MKEISSKGIDGKASPLVLGNPRQLSGHSPPSPERDRWSDQNQFFIILSSVHSIEVDWCLSLQIQVEHESSRSPLMVAPRTNLPPPAPPSLRLFR
ncbi:hypothetical protein DPMN_115117 [Dreissena polymorpha]|uniref:Uncharacterized protein n=1 Tax=Dreissena polymorpha TaxID=45954 RepID=A0A9D4KLD6_DREPO|nr:hypothetical protein DPMN_115117 [Dreissena polymorpha]